MAVEFGRKGALGVGARVGGLGLSPGWWYNIESTSVKHLLQQFKGAISEALACPEPMRAQLRATSAKQRFPVQQWVEDLEKLHVTSIKKHEKAIQRNTIRPNSWRRKSHVWWQNASGIVSRNTGSHEAQMTAVELESPPLPDTPTLQPPTFNARDSQYSSVQSAPGSPGLFEDQSQTPRNRLSEVDSNWPLPPTPEPPRTGHMRDLSTTSSVLDLPRWVAGDAGRSGFLQSNWCRCEHLDLAATLRTDLIDEISPTPSQFETPGSEQEQHMIELPLPTGIATPARSTLSMDAIVGLKKDFHLQKVDASFTDAKHEYQRMFEQKLSSLNAKNSFNTIIEEFIEKSTKDWYNRYLSAKLGKLAEKAKGDFVVTENPTSRNGPSVETSVQNSTAGSLRESPSYDKEEFLLAEGYKPPRGIRRFLLRRLGDWPFYSILLAFVSLANAYSGQC